MVEEVIKRLKDYGIELSADDYDLADFEVDKVIEYVSNICNVYDISEFSDNIQKTIIERACGGVMNCIKNSGKLPDLDSDGVIKQIVEGEVSIAFDTSAVMSEEQRIDEIIKYLMNYGTDIILSGRCIKW